MTFKNVEGFKFESAFIELVREASREYRRHSYVLESKKIYLVKKKKSSWVALGHLDCFYLFNDRNIAFLFILRHT